ncbi:MAG TPA: dihydrofolate reductase [Polyangiaceae bacterium]|nr:dihydrofolate reductase [Polyangiaceae bacterium]
MPKSTSGGGRGKPSSPMVSLIYARSLDYCIGKAGQIPWHLPDEFAHFKRTTKNHVVIMGRRTYEDHNTLLPDRVNIVVTTDAGYQAAEGILLARSFEEALELAEIAGREIFVVGGVRLFERSFPLAARIYETVVHTTIPDGDTFVPPFDFSGFRHRVLERHPVDPRHAFSFEVSLYERVMRND